MNKNFTLNRIGSLCLSACFGILAGCVNNIPAPVVTRDGQPSAVATADTHIVKSGETIYSIAREYGMDFRELIALNNIENPNQIAVGHALRIKSVTTDPQIETAETEPVSSDVVVAMPIDGEQSAVLPEVSSDMLKREPRAGKEPYSEQALAMAQGQTQTPESAETADTTTEAPTEQKIATPLDATVAPADKATAWIWPAGGKVVGTFGEKGNKGIDIAGRPGEPVIAARDGKVIHSGSGLRGYGKLLIIKHDNMYISAYAHNQTILVKQDQSVKKGQKIAEIGNTDTDQYKLHFEVRQQGKPVDPMKFLPAR